MPTMMVIATTATAITYYDDDVTTSFDVSFFTCTCGRPNKVNKKSAAAGGLTFGTTAQ